MTKRDAGGPSEGPDFFDVEKFAWGSIRLGCIELKIAVEAQRLADHLREFTNGKILAASDIHNLGGVIIFEKKETGVS